MFNYIISNKEWIFSGVGVFVMSGIFLLIRKFRSTHTRAPQSASVLDAPVIIKVAEPVSKKMLYGAGITRIKNGEYFLLPKSDLWANSQVRITLKEIDTTNSSVPRARLHLDIGGALVACGCAVKKIATNEFLLPARAGEEEDYSAFHFFTYPTAFHFVRVFISHINPHAGEVEVNFVQVRSIWQ